MRRKTFLYSVLILLLVAYSHHFTANGYSGSLLAQTTDNSTTSQKNIKKEKKKRMREQLKADRDATKRHWDIQTKATRKRMKKHLKETKKNVKNSHR